MRLRSAALAATLTVLVGALLSGSAAASPRHDHGLTINATPPTVISGEPVLIYGQLNVANPNGQRIVLYHRIGKARYFTRVATTTANAQGFYEFPRAEGVVVTNRSWFVRAPELSGNVHSRAVFEPVAAILSLTTSSTTANTGQPITFSGQISPPGHAGEPVYLQREDASTGAWSTLKSATISQSSTYSINYRFRVPGASELRVSFGGDALNVASSSDSVTVVIQQAQNPTFTIDTSAPVIGYGSSADLSGVLYKSPITSAPVPAPNVAIALWAASAAGGRAHPVQFATTGTDGSYHFTVAPKHNTYYFVRTAYKPFRRTAELFEGVRADVTLQPSHSTAPAGAPITFTGYVLPDQAGRPIELQRVGADGHYHTIAVKIIDRGSTYAFQRSFGAAGTVTLRTRTPGNPANVSGTSTPVQVTVTPALASAPPAS